MSEISFWSAFKIAVAAGIGYRLGQSALAGIAEYIRQRLP